MARLVVVDDDPGVREMLLDYLAAEGHAVRAAADGAALDRLLAEEPQPDLVVLDVGLPGEDGLRIARRLRGGPGLGIVMLTGAGDLIDRVVGLEIGADDYLAKPVALAELAARIAAVLRRRRPAAEVDGLLPFGRFRFDLKAWALRDATGGALHLGSMEVDLVAAFATNPGRVLTRDDLLRLAPPQGDAAYDRSIDHRITRLRRKLEDDPDRPQLIKTVRGAGYLHPRAAANP